MILGEFNEHIFGCLSDNIHFGVRSSTLTHIQPYAYTHTYAHTFPWQPRIACVNLIYVKSFQCERWCGYPKRQRLFKSNTHLQQSACELLPAPISMPPTPRPYPRAYCECVSAACTHSRRASSAIIITFTVFHPRGTLGVFSVFKKK